MVQRTGVRGISRMGRSTQGVKVMNVRNDDRVSAVAVVVETDASFAASVSENGGGPTGEEELPLEGSENGSNGSANGEAAG
jgi:DNA gyrase subunit A